MGPATLPLENNPLCNRACQVCHYKKFDYPSQLLKKQGWAETQLGSWASVLRTILPAPEDERLEYRSKTWLRSSFLEGKLSFGMFKSVKFNEKWEKEFISWDTCPLHAQAIQKVIGKLKEHLPRKVPDFLEHSLAGIWLGKPHLVVVSRNQNLAELNEINWGQILTPPFTQAWFHWNPQVGKTIFCKKPLDPLFHTSDPLDHNSQSIRAFRQVAHTLLAEARKVAVQSLLGSGPHLILELYCGTGDLSLLLPPSMSWIGIEQSMAAVNCANSLQRPEAPLHVAYVGAVEQRLQDSRVLSQVTEPYALYINPPRSGLTQQACSQVLSLLKDKPAASLIYLSCSASSLARDLKKIESVGYRTELLQPYDFFPQTEHFETLAVLKPR